MLEQLRRNSRSVIIWVLFGIIIAAFVLTFGTQSDVNMSGCASGATGTDVMVVGDEKVSVHGWRMGINSTQGSMNKLFRSQQVLDRLLEREILAQAAQEAGFQVTTDLTNLRIADGEFYILGAPGDGKSFYYRNGAFDYDILDAQVNAWGLPTMGEFIAQQKRELLANAMRQYLLQSAEASPEEVRARFVQENTRATLDLLQFRPSEYRSKINLDDAAVDAYLAAHGDEVRQRYQENERSYQGVGKQVKLRQMMFRPKKQAAAAEGSAGGETPDADPGLTAAQGAHAQLVAGADFATLASELSEDPRHEARGGDLGWRSLESPSLGARELGDALKNLKVGEVSDVITTPRGYYILKVEGEREGDLSFDDVKHELALNMAPAHYAKLAAERDARAALARAQSALAEGKRLDEVFERQAAPPPRPNNFNNLPPDMSPEELQQLLQQLQQQGSVTVDSADMPAEAPLQDDTAAAPAAPTGAAPAAPAAPATGEAIPVPADLVVAKLRKMGPFMRDADGNIAGLGSSEELMKAAFDELQPGQLAPRVYEVGESFVVAQLVSREDANLEELDEDMAQKTRELALEHGYRLYSEWLKERCSALFKAQDIRINTTLMSQLADTDDQKFSYRPFCAE